MTADPQAEVADRLRRLATAVAAQTTATPRPIPDEVLPLLAPVPDRRRGRVVAVAAALVLLVGVTAGVVAARRATSGDVVTRDPATDGGAGLVTLPGGVPALAPTWVPDGLVLEGAAVRDVEVPTSWIRRYRAPSPSGGSPGIDLIVRVDPFDPDRPAEPPVTNPDVAEQVDVNGRSAWVNHFWSATPISTDATTSDPALAGHSVTWDEPDGSQVVVSVRAVTPEAAVAVARGVRVEGATATIDPAALPAGYEEVYAGPQLEGILRSPNGTVASVALSYDERSPEPAPSNTMPPHLTLELVAAPAEVPGFVESFGPDVDVFEVGDVTYVASRTRHPQEAASITGLGGGVLVQVIGMGVSPADARRFVESLRPLDPPAWAAYLASARRSPYPERVPSAEAAPVCAELARLGDEAMGWMHEREAGSTANPDRPISDGSALAALADRAPEPLPGALRVLADYQRRAGEAYHEPDPAPGVEPPVDDWEIDHDGVVALREAVRTVDAWSLASCVDGGTEVQSVFGALPPLPNLDDQDPALDGFCQVWQGIRGRQVAEGYPLASSAAYAAELQAALALVPADHELRTTIIEVQTVWAATPDGEQYPVGVDRRLGNMAPIGNACPDWPTR